MEVTLDTISYLENTVFPQLAQQWRSENAGEEQILPHRLPLKRRLAEFRYGTSLTRRTSLATSSPNLSTNSPPGPTSTPVTTNLPSSIFSSSLWAIERFRDIIPAFVIAIFEDSIILEPGDVGPLQFSHPVAQHLIECINGQRLSRGLLAALRQFGAPFYDGCVAVGIVDYRRWAFGGIKADTNNVMTPEMHKILLKTPSELIIEDIEAVLKTDFDKIFTAGGTTSTSVNSLTMESPRKTQKLAKVSDEMMLEIEAKVLLAISSSVCLNPNPMVARIMTTFNYDIRKFKSVLKSPNFVSGLVEKDKEMPDIKSARIDLFLQSTGLITKTHQQRFYLLSTIDEKHNLSAGVNEPMYGLDARKDPSRLNLTSPPVLSWLGPQDSLWRTMRFEQRSDQRHISYTVHIVVNSSPPRSTSISHAFPMLLFEAIIRIGTQPCLGDIAEWRTNFPNKPTAESFVDQFKHTMVIEGKLCVADVSNPNAISSFMRTTVDPMTAATANFLSMPPHTPPGMFVPSIRPMTRPSIGPSSGSGIGPGQMGPMKQTIMFGSPSGHFTRPERSPNPAIKPISSHHPLSPTYIEKRSGMDKK